MNVELENAKSMDYNEFSIRLGLWKEWYKSNNIGKPNLIVEEANYYTVFVSSLDNPELPIISFPRIEDQRVVAISIQQLLIDIVYPINITSTYMVELLEKGLIDTIAIYPSLDYEKWSISEYRPVPVLVLQSLDEDINLSISIWNQYIIETYKKGMPYKYMVVSKTESRKTLTVFNKYFMSFECINVDSLLDSNKKVLEQYIVSPSTAFNLVHSYYYDVFNLDIVSFNDDEGISTYTIIPQTGLYPFSDMETFLKDMGMSM